MISHDWEINESALLSSRFFQFLSLKFNMLRNITTHNVHESLHKNTSEHNTSEQEEITWNDQQHAGPREADCFVSWDFEQTLSSLMNPALTRCSLKSQSSLSEREAPSWTTTVRSSTSTENTAPRLIILLFSQFDNTHQRKIWWVRNDSGLNVPTNPKMFIRRRVSLSHLLIIQVWEQSNSWLCNFLGAW